MNVLAIVIPAYKPDFFRAALASVVAQTDRRFKVYVGDDAGPPEIGRICTELAGSGVDIVYHRFAENLGGRSLPAHWNRCVALSGEPWVWLFSDDDLMTPDCVAAVHEQLAAAGPENVLRFNTEVIDGHGETIAVNALHPVEETGVDFIHSRLRGERNSYVVEYVFRRAAFDRAGGFPDYPVAWCSDDVAWFSSSESGKIRTLSRGLVRWRASGLNITDAKRRNQREKLEAGARFLRFVRERVEPADHGVRGPGRWRDAERRWWIGQIRYLMPIGPSLWPLVLRTADGVWRRSRAAQVVTLAWWNTVATLRALRGVVRRRLARRVRG
ncbi:MAG: glycosyltransferase family 2 protein [Gemmatimonadetes bacterium]|nr:glycosyltransferase family 2 protein [Gemmatimonadota bacterium]